MCCLAKVINFYYNFFSLFIENEYIKLEVWEIVEEGVKAKRNDQLIVIEEITTKSKTKLSNI